MPGAALPAETATPASMYATWLMVDQASSRFRSSWANAATAAPVMLIDAITAATSSAPGTARYSGSRRATRNTPAATMVAAWIRAEIGVGPSIASGNQVCSGNWADLPATPARKRSAAASRVVWGIPFAATSRIRIWMDVVRALAMRRITASRTPMSPARVTKNALRAAARAAGRSE